MLQLVLAMLVMYATIGAAAMWYRKHSSSDRDGTTVMIRTRTEGTN